MKGRKSFALSLVFHKGLIKIGEKITNKSDYKNSKKNAETVADQVHENDADL